MSPAAEVRAELGSGAGRGPGGPDSHGASVHRAPHSADRAVGRGRPGHRARRATPSAGAVQRVHVLREHRGACHLAAVRLSGLSARDAMVLNLGVDRAERYGRPEPRPVDTALTPRLRRAERLTDELQAPLFAALTAGQRADFAGLVDALTAGGAG